ncbi:MAG: DUF4209 domain-containing protein [Verrucomicrobiota bacterium]
MTDKNDESQIFEGYVVTSKDIITYASDWVSILKEEPMKECFEFQRGLFRRAKELKDAGDGVGFSVHRLLGRLCSYMPNYDISGNPYGPFSPDGKHRSHMAEDLTEDDLDALEGIVENVEDSELGARISDVIWECRKSHIYARKAVGFYIDSAKRLENADSWTVFAERLERALQLAAKLGYHKDLHMQVIGEIEAVIERYKGDVESGLLCARMMRYLMEYKSGDPAIYAALSEKLAAVFQAREETHFADDYWELACRWHRKAGSGDDELRCGEARGDSLINRGEQGKERNGAGYAAHWVGKGIEVLRQSKADTEKIKKIHLRFLELQKASLAEMSPMEINFEEIPGFKEKFKKSQEAARNHVHGYSFQEAIMRFILITRPIDPVSYKKQVEENNEQFLHNMFPAVSKDYSGKVAATSPGISPSSDADNEQAFRDDMWQQAKESEWPYRVDAIIEPARRVLLNEHSFRMRDLSFLIQLNPFVPEGHEYFYLRGIQAGFYGDWIVAAHILIPQLEQSIRYVFQQHDVVTSTLESDGTQKEHDIGWLLCHTKMRQIFGEDIAFDLRGNLIERFGHNLRNEMSHGLAPDGAYFTGTVCYVWWLTLGLLLHGYRCVREQLGETEGTPLRK